MLFVIGIIAGIISGMGIGGGAIMIPALVFFAGISQHNAQGINLIFFIPTAIVALFVHVKNKNVDFKAALPIVAFGLVAALIGSSFALNIEGNTLRRIFGCFLLVVGIYELFRKNKD